MGIEFLTSQPANQPTSQPANQPTSQRKNPKPSATKKFISIFFLIKRKSTSSSCQVFDFFLIKKKIEMDFSLSFLRI